MATNETVTISLKDMTIEVFDGNYDKESFYRLMGESFALKSVRKELPYLDNEPGRIWFVAVHNNPTKQVIGFVSLQEKPTKVVLKNDYVYPDFRRKGVYSKLNEKRLEYAQRLSKPLSILATKDFTSYYQQIGFKVKNKLVKLDHLWKEQ
ncbi:MAG: GNAT family N-acetyltransferase [Candidatus Heimdallarchaeota archaeon]